MAITFHRECDIQTFTWNNGGDDWTTSMAWYTPWKNYSDNVYEPIAKGIRLYEINGTGDAKKTRIDLTLHAHKYSQSLGQNPFVRLYVLSNYPSQPRNIPAYALATKDVAIDENTSVYNITIDGFNVTAFGKIYVAIVYSGDNILSILFNKKVNVTVEADETPPTCSMWRPTSGEEKFNYNNIEINFSVTSPAGMTMSEAQLQCSYDNNDWTNPVVSQTKNNYTVPANTFHGGTIYCRCRAKTAYSEWGEWAYDSFTAVERAVTVTNVTPNYGYNYRSYKQPIELSWETNSEIDHITLKSSELQYSTDDGTTWVDLDTVDGDETSYTVPANFFPARGFTSPSSYVGGGIRWRVRCYNANDEPGQWKQGIFATLDNLYSNFNLKPSNSASVNETKIAKFQWDALNNIGDSVPTNIDIEYRYPDGNWQPLSITNLVLRYGACTCEVPANTFNPSVIYWHVRSYNQDNIAGDWSYEASFTTIDAPSIATPISPIGTIEDTDSDLLFRWSSYSSSGTLPTQADIQYSYDGNTWISLEPTDGTPYTTVPGGTIHAGTIQWRVRSYNRNHTQGNWSDPAVFVARAAPKIQEVTADGKPFTTITWQATDQQTYEIEVDGYSYGSIFGIEKSFQLPDYLEDGIHSVRVRVQNEMSMWSQPGELTFSVLNTPGAELLLSGDFDLDADLFWEDNSGHADYLVYRDGTCIGETSHKHFSDRVVLGEHTYYVVNRFDDGCFSKSNIVEHTLNTDFPQLALLSGGDWLPLEKSENAQQTQRFTHNRKVAYHHFSGDKNPTPEVGDEEVLIAEFDAAWFYTEEGSKTLKSLLGQALIIKSRGEEVVIGVLEAYTKVNHKHFRGYAFSIRQMEWKDYICAE